MSESGPAIRPKKTSEAKDLQEIGKGVWKASLNGRFYILKTAKDNDADSRVLLRREFEFAAALQHPFIAATLEFLEDSPVGPAILMDYVAGKNLREFLAEKPSAAIRAKILNQLLDAVEYLHRRGMLHNDIKPENILVTDIGADVKLIDFGLSESDADYLNKRLGGTEGATSPEALSGDTDDSSTASSDIYSLGAIIALLYPFGYRRIVNKCRRPLPQDRFRDISSLRRAIAGAGRRPFIVGAFVLIVCLLVIFGSGALKERREALHQREAVEQIRRDLDVFFSAASDSISDSSLVPYQEFAMLTRNTFVESVYAYKIRLHDSRMLFVCDTVYARMLGQLNQQMASLPSFMELYSKGRMTEAEADYYGKLFADGRGYAQYPGRKVLE